MWQYNLGCNRGRDVNLNFDLDDKQGIFNPIFHGLSESYVVKNDLNKQCKIGGGHL